MGVMQARLAVLCVGVSLFFLAFLVGATASIAGVLDASWTAPTTNTDGSPLSDLALYRIYYATQSTPCPGSTGTQIASPTASPATNQTVALKLTGLTAGTSYSVAVTAVDAAGLESACSTVASAVARAEFSVAPTGIVNFGAVSLGSYAEQTLTVSNTSGASLSGSASVAAPFSIVSGSPFTLAGLGASQVVRVRFTPTTTTTVSSTLKFAVGGDTVSVVTTGSGAAAAGGVAVADATPPIVTITSPTSAPTYAVTAPSLTLQGTASDNVGVTQVTWSNSRGGSGVASGTSSWTASGIALQVGSNTLTVTARDAAGNAATATLALTLSDTVPPTAAITAPAPGSTVSGTINVAASATDNVAVAGVQFKLDGANLGAERTSLPYTVQWNTTTAAAGPHVLTAVARDAAGNVTTSAGATVTVANAGAVDTTAPVISQVSMAVTASTVTIGWTTNKPSTTQVQYSTQAQNGTTTRTYQPAAPVDPTLVTSHSQVLTGLTPNTWYYFRATSSDAAGNLGVSGDFRFKTRNR
jgi:Big-like domain-containing protein/purple acid phosphatase-like protein/ASPM-SPD-2-Hydin domain-containing protein